jgi:peptidoglycan/LPS O-acetylase OafA/YrhL
VEIDDKSRNIPSLDGMRAISILLVIVAHSSRNFSAWIKIPLGSYLLFAHTGVSVFFVISGFLITSLLLREQDATGTISLGRFYLRRACRIFPPFYIYLGIIFALTVAGAFHAPLRAFLFAATYTSNYYLGPDGGFAGIQHIWSLSVEEQFYVLWPGALLLLGKRRAIGLAGFLILISPLSRVLTYLALAPQHRAMVDRMFHSSIDTIMFGCLLALLWDNERFHRLEKIWTSPWSMAGATLFLFVVDPILDLHYRGYNLVIGMTLEGLSICLITLYVVKGPKTFAGRFLNTPLLRHIGIISYGLYLWQSIFTVEGSQYFPLNLAAIVACAELSYWAVERPSRRLRDLWLKRIGGATAAKRQTVSAGGNQ